MDLFAKTRKEFLEYCRWVAIKIFKQKGNVSVDDLRQEVQLPLNIDGRVFGAVFQGKQWKKVGYKSTSVKSSHGRPVAIFIHSDTK